MKLITLNTWGGLAGREGLLSFFEKHKNEVDIFCLQEVWDGSLIDETGKENISMSTNLSLGKKLMNGKKDISEILSNYAAYFRPQFRHYGLSSFVRNDIKVIDEGEVFVHKEKNYIPQDDIGYHARNMQYMKIDTKNGERTVINFHGLWNGQGKSDSNDRLLQADNIVRFINNAQVPIIMCGDFNLLPTTESIKRIENTGLTNLIRKHNVTSTRTSFYTKPEKFADYIFVSPDIDVVDFKVLPDEVSDHSPLYIEFNP